MVVQHNMTAINANRYLGINNTKLGKSLEKLSSGYAINRAGDNAAGLAVSEKMRSQIAGMTQGVKNAQDGISMVQTFEGALTETDSILQRMKTLATQSANGTYDDSVDRAAIQLEFDQLNDELNQIADTDFNGVVVLNGGKMADGLKAGEEDNIFDYSKYEDDPQEIAGEYSTAEDADKTLGDLPVSIPNAGAYDTTTDVEEGTPATPDNPDTPEDETVDAVPGSTTVTVAEADEAPGTAKLTYANNVSLQVGARTKDLVNFTFSYKSDGIGDLVADLNCTADGLGTASLSLATQDDANKAIDKIDNAINKTNMVRATFGAIQNRLEHKIDNMNVTVENLTSAESRIRDTDMATEMMNFTKQNILTQASQSMLAQANQLPQSVLSLLQ